MSAKLHAGQYPDRAAFRDDFKLIIQNAITYNVAGLVVDLANKLDAVFNKQWDRIEATLRAMEGPSNGAPARAPRQAVHEAEEMVSEPAATSLYQPPAYNPTPAPNAALPPRASAQLFERRPPSDDTVGNHSTIVVPPRASSLFQQRDPVPPAATPSPAPPAALSKPTNVAFDGYNPFAPTPAPPVPTPQLPSELTAPTVAPTETTPAPSLPAAPSVEPAFADSVPEPTPAPVTAPPSPPHQANPAAYDLATAQPAPEPTPEPSPAPAAAPVSLGLSFKFKAPARPPQPTPPAQAVATPLPPPPPPQIGPSFDSPPKPSGFKITLGGASKPPKAHPAPGSDDGDDGEWGSRSSSKMSRESSAQKPHKKKKHKDTDREKIKKEVSYAEPDDDDDLLERLPAPAAPAAVAGLPSRPEILDQPPLPHPSRWFNPYDAVDDKKARAVISKVSAMREAFWFLQPVDPIALPMSVCER